MGTSQNKSPYPGGWLRHEAVIDGKNRGHGADSVLVTCYLDGGKNWVCPDPANQACVRAYDECNGVTATQAHSISREAYHYVGNWQ